MYLIVVIIFVIGEIVSTNATSISTSTSIIIMMIIIMMIIIIIIIIIIITISISISISTDKLLTHSQCNKMAVRTETRGPYHIGHIQICHLLLSYMELNMIGMYAFDVKRKLSIRNISISIIVTLMRFQLETKNLV